MKSVLLISNTKPDEPGGAAEKLGTRKRLLREYGWSVSVGHVPVDAGIGPLPPLSSVSNCYRIALENDVDIVGSVSEPQQLHGAGYLVSRLAGIPWLAEFRDPLVTKPTIDPDSRRASVRRCVERFVLRNASRVTWDNGIQLTDDYFETTYPDVPSDTYRKLPFFGFEREKIEDVAPRTYDPFTITYAGSFYDGWIEPYAFLEELGRYVEKGSGDDIRVRFYGDWKADYERAVEDAGVSDIVETHDWVTYEEMVSVLKGSDVALYVGGTDPRNERNVPQKIFDYVGARTPILAVVDPTFRVANFVRREGLGVVASPNTPGAIADRIAHLRSGRFDHAPTQSALERFSRRRKIEALADVLDGLVSESSSDQRRHP